MSVIKLISVNTSQIKLQNITIIISSPLTLFFLSMILIPQRGNLILANAWIVFDILCKVVFLAISNKGALFLSCVKITLPDKGERTPGLVDVLVETRRAGELDGTVGVVYVGAAEFLFLLVTGRA